MNLRSKLTYIAIGIQLLILAGMLAKAMYPLLVGTPVRLRVEARDPRDVFRGHYAELYYPMNNIRTDTIENHLPRDACYNFGDIVYVELVKKNDEYVAKALWPKPPKNTLAIKGIVQYRFCNDGSMAHINLKYGIEQFFSDKHTAEQIENSIRGMGAESTENFPIVYANVYVTSSGDARIASIEYK
ncbi:MAG: GDYXXLXY domain-containing protein [Cytophagaceae bacterium]|nr:GDYXXLXY domain-containing protein [Cytophagaceae bacterium]MDW8455834.1 GDYXXLXY domain-containing protein [Cytophagaceae bacterium]